MHHRVTVAVVALLVVIGTLIFAPVVYMVREAQGRIACTNNLKQLGLALGNYHSTHGTFPPGTLPNVDLPPERRLSWFVLLFPYIEARPKLLLDRTKAWDADENRIAYESNEPKFADDAQRAATEPKRVPVGKIGLFLCPNNPHRESPGFSAPVHYVGIGGVGPEAARLPKDNPSAGVFGYDRSTAVKDIKGQANTLLLLETTREIGPWTAGGRSTVRGLDTDRQPYLGPGHQFGGTHRGVAMPLFADGSVRMLEESMDAKVLEAMARAAAPPP